MLGPDDFPTRENCDPTNPREAFLWMFVALPGQLGGPLLMPISEWQDISERLWNCGARPVEEPVVEWVPPSASDPNWITSPGYWVDAGDAPKLTEEQAVAQALAGATMQQRGELLEAIRNGEPYPNTPAGREIANLTPRRRDVVRRVLESWSEDR